MPELEAPREKEGLQESGAVIKLRGRFIFGSNGSTISPNREAPQRLKMDTAEEPQKKIFKARKTMKATDRQQLEAIHKAKEDLLKPTDVKLVNGSHENGDSEMNSFHNTDSLENKNDLNSVKDYIHCDKLVKVSLSDFKEDLKSVDLVSDLKLPQESNLSENIFGQATSMNVVDGKDILASSNDTLFDEQKPFHQVNDQNALEGLALLEDVSGDTFSELSRPNIPIEGAEPSVVKEVNELEAVEKESKSFQSESADTFLGMHGDEEDKEPEVYNLELPDRDSMECDTVEMQDNSSTHCQNEVNENKFHCDENIEETEKNVMEQTFSTQEPELISNVVETGEKQQTKTVDDLSVQHDGEEAISSSAEVDQTLKLAEQNATVMEKASPDKPVYDLQPGNGLASLDSMETDEIIPILEKLAPVENELQSFSKPDLNSESAADEENAEDFASSSKNDANTSLPREAFLVLSDEDELCDVITPKENASSEDQDTDNLDTKKAPEVEEQQTHQETVGDPEAEKCEVPHRKRSKSEDLDSHSSKRRRFEGEEYEAELKVKITSGDDLDKKLQKVIQRLFEEKLSALRCADFDKAIADLRTRVEKIECKKHESVLHSIQAKIGRLTKRFGAAKEDLKRRHESAVTRCASPGKSVVKDSTPNNISNSTSTNYRNTGTVRQMLESKRGVVETVTTNLQMSAAVPSTASNASSLTPRLSSSAQIPVTQSPSNGSVQTRAPPDWKLIQQKINAQNTQSVQSKPNTPVTSAPIIPSVLASPTATVVGSSQVSTSNTQPMSVSLQSLPVILHVPVAMSSQSQILQGATGTLVTNQQSGNVEFIPVQNQPTVGNLTKTPVTVAVTKAISSPSIPSPSIQRNSPASSVSSTLAVQAIPANHPVTISRPSLTTVGSSGIYNQTSNRNTAQLKLPGFNISSEASSGGRTDLQISRAPVADPAVNKRTSDSNSQAGKSAGVIDLTLDDEDPDLSSQDSKRASSSAVPTNVQLSQSVVRQSQMAQINNPQSSAPVGLASQATMHVVPTAQTTVNITQRPGTQSATRPSAPRLPSAGHMVYTTTTLPSAPAPIRNTVMQNQNLRQMTPQAGGVSVRMPQTATYVVNNGMPLGSGPQLTVHHRPPQEAARPIHPAPLPEAPQPQRLPPEAASTSVPQKPHLKLARVQSQNGIVLSWSVLEVDRTCAAVDSYHLYAYHEDPSATSPSQWKKIGEVKALPLPMACTLTQFVSGSKYYFAVRAKDVYGRFGPFCDPQSTDVISTQSS